jgi:exopolysaccharide/PEP-CTERM locus tyrosine autokinase
LGKIFSALEKFRKERTSKVSGKLRNSDYDLLLRFDEKTGRLETDDPSAIRNSGSLNRLMTYRLIDAGGKLTPAGSAKYQELRRIYKDRKPERPVASSRPKQQAPQATWVSKLDKLSASDWVILTKYDRKSGNLLTYDPGTGRLDQNSTAILKDPAIIQRLIDADMILPGGWLTPQAKRGCARIAQKLKRKQINGSAKREITVATNRTAQPAETLSQDDLDVLLQCDPKTRKLDLNNAAIANNPGIVERLLANEIITPDGRLTPKGLLNWQIMTRWSPTAGEKEPAAGGQKQSIAEKLPKVADKTQLTAPSAESGQKKVKIISFEEDEQPLKKRAEEVRPKDIPAPANKSPHTAPKPDKNRKKDDLQIPRHAAPAAGPHRSTVGGRFTLNRPATRYDKKAIDKNLVSLSNPQSFEAEQFKILRTNLLFPANGESPRSIMVTSAVPGEGKSFVAANLAVSVARHLNRSVLLIDCDLRRPSIHRQFGFGGTPGLSDYLSRGIELPSLLLKTGVDHLTILPAGRPPSNPSELLSSERMSHLIEEVSARYHDRVIIIDSPPAKLAAESGALARQVDGILVVVKYASTPREIVTELIDKLGPNKVLGAIVNNFEMMSPYYSKKYYGYYGKPYRQK